MVGFVTSFPDCCKIDCFCLEWGLKDFPNIGSDWWCEGTCFCCFENCGMKELMETQILCLGPCSKPELKTTFSFPELCVINFCCFKYGCKDFPNLYTDKLITQKWLCIDCSVGFGNMNFLSNQCFCIKT